MIADFSSPVFRTFFESIITRILWKQTLSWEETTRNYVRNEVLSAKHNTVYCKDMYVKYGQEVDSLGKWSLILIVIQGAKLLEWTWKRRKR
jgi:hypothetical protein